VPASLAHAVSSFGEFQEFVTSGNRCMAASYRPSSFDAKRWEFFHRCPQRSKLVMRINRVHLGAGVSGELLPNFL
jgi:hypothetical protein